ncbi:MULTISPECIES: DUF427 domain-containing protein [Thiorhodovibrio]|uniref:DUF427 domain-containing protein n=1 Tax=Thiorhodovibrio TaxID=61593 RepID=UPI00191240D2|nr:MULTISPECIES: DUF427 domain-containing protein [Thiorhodovibrio]MBK5969308.1 hypothetical protein [Thiorhodovibrio winogradskyi]WPL11942.1 hypothetical protein Thiosp_01695 [Thiorhodovibrio litoralis]
MPAHQSSLQACRDAWQYRGQQRPPFAQVPEPGQESVWDYPRPPIYRPDDRLITVHAGESRIANTESAIRALETGSPPSVYLPPEAVDQSLLEPSQRRTLCEWKGQAEYFHVKGPQGLIRDALWRYPQAWDEAAVIAGYFSCYPVRLDCFVGGERVRPQAGGYYGGWITDDVVGPFKGEPGTGHW